MKAKILLNRNFMRSKIDPRIYGGFAEHLGRCVYDGIYEPEHPEADSSGFRKDVLKLAKDLSMPTVRYPGGNFVSGYNWEDGVGPKDKRPTRPDGAWMSLESNQFGTDEFMDWCKAANTAPMLAVNLGTRGPDAARNLVEYCNFPGGTKYSEMRREYGHNDPHGVKLWCLGNEMDGPWQMGHKTATEYGRCACESAKLMKMIDPDIELVACGSSGRSMKTFGEWEAEVLNHTFDHVDYISLHTYFGNAQNDTPSFLGYSENMESYIKETAACCDYVSAKRKSSKRIMLSFDEWNVWYHSHDASSKYRKNRVFREAPPILEDVYNFEDALAVGCMLNALINNADRVKIACIAQIVNVIAPIMTQKNGSAWKQTIYYPFFYASNFGRGSSLMQIKETSTYDADEVKNVPYLCSSSVLNENGGVRIFAINRSLDKKINLKVEFQDFGGLESCEWIALKNNDLKAENTMDKPENVTPFVAEKNLKLSQNSLNIDLLPASWNMLNVAPEKTF